MKNCRNNYFIGKKYEHKIFLGMAQLDAKSSGRIGCRALTYYIATTILAAIVGIAMVLIIHPGDPRIKTVIHAPKTEDAKVSTLDAILDIIRYSSGYLKNDHNDLLKIFSFEEIWCRKTWSRRVSNKCRRPM